MDVPSEVATLDARHASSLATWPVPVHAFYGHGNYGWTTAFTHWLRARASKFSGIFVHGLWQWQGLGTRQAVRGTEARYWLFPHGMLDPWFRQAFPWRHARKAGYWKCFEHRVVRDAAGIVFTSEEERRSARATFQPWLAQREFVIPLGTTAPPQPAEALRARFEARFPQLRGERILLFLGRLHEKKGCDLLIEAFRRVAPPMHLVFAGPCADARFEADLRARAEGLRVTFTGPLYGDDKWAALAAAEVFVLPSHQENFGVAVAEALASGVPVLLSQRVNIWREIVEDGAGFAEVDDLEGTVRLLERWRWLAADQAVMRLAAQRCFAARFDIRRTAENLLALIPPRS
ncbi:MAG: glycosyltransferase [Chthoniobacter sp.]|uniref:glycosyltransferase n=1 Tax=Chthoniobacter sp. TaxID=2510640 RepID=UPI0032A95B8B